MKTNKNGTLTISREELSALIAKAVAEAQATTHTQVQQPKAAKSTKSKKATPSKKSTIDWGSLPVRKTLNSNQVAHRAIVKTLKGLKGNDYKKEYDALWASWREWRDQ